MPHKIELYGVIGSEWFGMTARQLITELARIEREEDDQDIDLHVNSGGGYVQDAVAMYNRLRRHKGQVHVIIDALAASAATIVAMAGDLVTIPRNATMMIHQPWGVGIGTADDMRDAGELLDMTESQMVAMYVKRTGLEDAEIRQMLADETWLTAEEALAKGFVDEIEDEDDAVTNARAEAATAYAEAVAVASDDLPKYRRAPAWANTIFQAAPRRTDTGPRAVSTKEQEMKLKNGKPVANDETPDETPDETTVDETEVQTSPAPPADLAAQENNRVVQIVALCDQHSVPAEVRNELLKPGVTMAAATSRILAHLAAKPTVQSSLRIERDEAEKRTAGVQRAIEFRAGLLSREEAAKERGNEFLSYSLSEIAALFHDGPRGSSRKDLIGRVLASARIRNDIGITHTTSDFPSILANVAEKAMLIGWEGTPATFEPWTNRGTLSNFHTAKRVGLNLFPDLSLVEEGAEFQNATIGDREVSIALGTYGRMFGITRQAIINDDVQAFTEVPRKMGAAARRTINQLAYAVLTGNALLDDGVALFAAGHNNTSAVDLDAAGVAELEAEMLTQTGPDTSKALGIRPSHLVVPAALGHKARQLMNGQIISDGTVGVSNVMNGAYNVIVEPLLDASSAANFYLAADGSQYDTVEVAYLDGNDQPRLEQQDGWRTDGTEFKVAIDAGVAVRDYRGLQRGTAGT